jgi:hypothetical protein
MEMSSALLMLVTLTATNIVWSANLAARADGGESLRSRVSSRADTGIHAHVKLPHQDFHQDFRFFIYEESGRKYSLLTRSVSQSFCHA